MEESCRRVVVTGIGLVTPLGCGVNLVWKRINDKISGIQKLNGKLYEKLPCRIGGIVPMESHIEGNLDIYKKFSEAERRSSSVATLYGLVAAEEAIKDSSLNINQLKPEELEKIGVEIGMGLPDLQDIQDTGEVLKNNGYNRVSPYFIPRILLNLAAGQISMKYGFQGPNHCSSTACATGAHSIGDSFNFIKNGYCDMMVCGGAEASINPLSIATFCRLRALSTKYNSNPTIASRPFDKDRDGFVMGEGAGVLVLEELKHAKNRHAKIYAEILGYGLSGDAHHLTAARQDGNGALKSMKQALTIAKIDPINISYVNCHATSTPIGDKAEIQAILKLFGNTNVKKLAISSTKGSHGHLLGAAGAVESILTILACKTGIIPPCLNIENLDEEFKGLNIVTDVQQLEQTRRIALKNSFGFGGTNASLCFSSFSEN